MTKTPPKGFDYVKGNECSYYSEDDIDEIFRNVKSLKSMTADEALKIRLWAFLEEVGSFYLWGKHTAKDENRKRARDLVEDYMKSMDQVRDIVSELERWDQNRVPFAVSGEQISTEETREWARTGVAFIRMAREIKSQNRIWKFFAASDLLPEYEFRGGEVIEALENLSTQLEPILRYSKKDPGRQKTKYEKYWWAGEIAKFWSHKLGQKLIAKEDAFGKSDDILFAEACMRPIDPHESLSMTRSMRAAKFPRTHPGRGKPSRFR
ncbi:MAG: hypothetical protein AAFX54_11405 [Pseudomonadota bacterium]